MNPASPTTRPPLPLRVAIAVGLIAGSVLALQVLLTRLFSAALFYHFSFLSISLALLGAGGGAMARLNVCAPTDDKPFFFQMRRLSSLGNDGAGYIYAAEPFALLLGCLLIAVSAFALQPLLTALIGLPFPVRLAFTVVLLAPAGVALGMAMPLGLSRLAALHPRGVAWAWGVNGIASVVPSAGAITIAILAGYSAATLVALACYLGALAHVRVAEWPHTSPEARATRRQPHAAVADPVDG